MRAVARLPEELVRPHSSGRALQVRACGAHRVDRTDVAGAPGRTSLAREEDLARDIPCPTRRAKCVAAVVSAEGADIRIRLASKRRTPGSRSGGRT